MKNLLPACLSLVVASLISGAELVSSKYPRTFFLLKRCPWLYGYVLIYGLISFGVMLGMDALTNAGAIKLEGAAIGNSWVQALAIGFSMKALLHIRFFTITSGSESFPLGTEIIAFIFEPWFLSSIALQEFNNMRKFIEPRSNRYPSIKEVRSRIKTNLPKSLSPAEKKALELDISRMSTTIEALEFYLTKFGRGSLDRVFPEKPPQVRSGSSGSTT